MPLIPSLSIIGHVCHDIIQDGHRLGGSASYAAFLARAIGYQPEVITSFSEEFAYRSLFDNQGIVLSNNSSEHTTVFSNKDKGDSREQKLLARANDIILDATSVNTSDIVFICPIADEIDISGYEFMADSLVVGLLQGWMRNCSNLGRIVPKELNPDILPVLDIALCSEEDIKPLGKSYLDQLIQQHDHVVITQGSRGVTIYQDKQPTFLPSFKTEVIDTTGAGDIFGMAYSLAYYEHRDIITATTFAHAAASLSIEEVGTNCISTLEDILSRQELYKNLYL